MARPREFDADAALDRALSAFWAKGYAGTSLDDLCVATGLNRSSLYGAFGDKRSIYLQALDRYERNGVAHIAALLAQGPIRNAFEKFLDRLIDDIVAGPGRRGCFIGNCAAELERRDRRTAARVGKSLESIELTFREALAAAKLRNELSNEVDANSLATYLTAAVQGLRLVGKANPDRRALTDIAHWTLQALESQSESGARSNKPRQPASPAARRRETNEAQEEV